MPRWRSGHRLPFPLQSLLVQRAPRRGRSPDAVLAVDAGVGLDVRRRVEPSTGTVQCQLQGSLRHAIVDVDEVRADTALGGTHQRTLTPMNSATPNFTPVVT